MSETCTEKWMGTLASLIVIQQKWKLQLLVTDKTLVAVRSKVDKKRLQTVCVHHKCGSFTLWKYLVIMESQKEVL